MAASDLSTPGDGGTHFTSDITQLLASAPDATKHINIVGKDTLVVNTPGLVCSALIVTSATGGLKLAGCGYVTVGKLKIGPQPGYFEKDGATPVARGQA